MRTPRSRTRRPLLLSVTVVLSALLTREATGQRTGEQIFNTVCIACHTIGEGGRPLLGPDLKYARMRLTDTEWLKKFIRSSQTLVKAGDERAVTAFNHFNKVVMPDNVISDSEMDSLILFLDAAAGLTDDGEDEDEENPPDPDRGRDIFQGRIRLTNRGPSCISCHHVKNDAVIGGGILAKDLTQVFSRLGGSAAVRAIIGSQPFPVMERAYRDNPLEPREVADLVAFLEKADKEHELQHPMDYGIMLLTSGLGGAILLYALFALFWRGRKRDSVNAEIYKRQLASS